MNAKPGEVFSSGSEFVVQPAQREDLEWISSLQQKLYSAADAVPLSKLQEWFEINPGGFYAILDRDRRPVGQITFLPLKADCLDRYRLEGPGGIIETEIRGEDLHGRGEEHLISDLYLESLILPELGRSLAMRNLLKSLPKMIVGLKTGLGDGQLFALAATPSGARWLERMGLSKISHAEARRDGHDMYGTTLADFLSHAADA